MYLPNQRLSDAQKIEKFGSIEEWGREVIQALLSFGNFSAYSSVDYPAIQTNLDLYNGYLNMRDFSYVTNPYGVTNAKFPAELQNYNIIKPKIDLLVGEEIKRPFNFKVISTNPDSITQIEEKKKEMVIKMLQELLTQELYNQGHIPDKEDVPQDTMSIPQIEEYIQTNYSDMREILGQQALDYLLWYLDLKTKFNKGFKEYLVTGSEIYYAGIISNEPDCRAVDSRYFYCELSSDTVYVEDAQYCYYRRYLTPADIYDEFYETLTEDDITKIESIRNNTNYLTLADNSLGVPITYSDIDMSAKGIFNTNSLIPVTHICWQGLRRIGFLTYTDLQTGEPQEAIVDESYQVRKEFGETIEWKWINEVWEGTKIGAEIFVNVRPVPNQSKSLDNPSKCKLPYVGVYKHNSLVSIMKPHQYFYDILMYRLELSLARAKDKIMLMDIAQIPRSMGIDTEKWMYYMDTLGVAFINSFEEGTGKFAGKAAGANFNQFQAIDMSLSNIMGQYIGMLSKIEDMVGEISGVSRQRQGQVQTSELVGNVERSVVQSSHITEPLFYCHSEVKRRVLTQLVEISKVAWMNGKKGQYVTDDLQRVYFNIDGPEFADAEFGVFIGNSSKDDKVLQTLQQLAQAAVQSGTVGLKDIADILSTDSIANVKRKLAKAEDAQHKKLMELEDQKQKGIQQQLQLQLADKDKDRQILIDNNIRDNDTKLEIAGMSTDEVNATPPEDMTAKLLEVNNKMHIEQQKLKLDSEKQNKELILAKEKQDKEYNIEEQYLTLEKDKVNHDKKIDVKELAIKKIAAKRKPTTK